MEETKSVVCEKCSNYKDVIILTKNTEQKCVCIQCVDNHVLYDGWKHNDFEICEECECVIQYSNKNVYILNKNDEEKIWCVDCFNKLWKQAYNDGWGGDDIEEEILYQEKYF